MDRQPPQGPTVSDRELTARFRAALNEEVADAMPKAVIVFLAMMTIAFAIEGLHHTERLVPLTVTIFALTATCVGGIAASRGLPGHAPQVTLVTVLLLAIILATYQTQIGDNAILSLLGMIGYLTGLVVLFPWGPWFQAAAATGIMLIHLVTLSSFDQHLLAPVYGMFALATHAFMTILGAALLERYRWSAFCEATQAEHNAREAARANQAKSNFLASVSHELRTPLNIIFGYTDLLIEDGFDRDDERQDALRRIRAQSGNLLGMIQTMLDVNKLEAGGVAVDPSEFSVGDLIDNLKLNVPPSWCKDGVVLEWDVPGAEAIMRSDSDKIETVLRNLIHNALKYTEQGKVHVRAAATPGNCKVDFTVTDTGKGIPADDLDQIFQMFRQSGSRRQGGVGLGLFLARQLTEALGGTIRAESDLGRGSVFTVALPLQLPRELAD